MKKRRNFVDILLVDDPSNLHHISGYTQRARAGLAKLVVVGFDPLQLDDAITDAQFSEYRKQHRPSIHVLRTCYRQKKNVGIATKRVVDTIAKSTPFLRSPKIANHHRTHARLTALSNKLRFTNPLGYVEVYPDAKADDVASEVNRVISQPGGLWKHVPPVLVAVIDDRIERLPRWFAAQLQRIPAEVRILRPRQLHRAKGLEFQHVFVVSTGYLIDELTQGFGESGRTLYNDRRLLRIPFSRAKDSLVTFGIVAHPV